MRQRVTVLEKYPLDPAEEQLLRDNLAASQALLLLLGVAGCVLVSGLSDGKWLAALAGFGWARVIAEALVALDVPQALLLGLGMAAAFLLVGTAMESWAMRSEEGRRGVVEARRGVNGEMVRLSLPLLALLMCMAGFAEELLFRVVALGGVLVGLSLVMPVAPAALLAVTFSSIVFWMAHVRYRDLYSTILVLLMAVALGLCYLFTASLTAVWVAHTAYDLADLVVERRRMATEEDYFGGAAPSRVMLDELDEMEEQDEEEDD